MMANFENEKPTISLAERVQAKYEDAQKGIPVEFDPDEAEYAGAFIDRTLSEQEALDSRASSMDFGEDFDDEQ